MWRRTANTKGLLNNHMETYISWSFLKCKTEIEMELPYNGEDNVPTRNHMLSSKTPSVRNGLHLVESLVKGHPQTPAINNIGYWQCHWSPSRTWQWVPIAEDTTYLFHQTWKNWAGAQLEALAIPTSIQSVGRYHTHHQRRKVIISLPELQTLRPITVPCLARYTGTKTAQKLWSNQQIFTKCI